LYEIGYAGNNGHPYTPIAEAMIQDGVIGRNQLSLATLIRTFRARPELIDRYCWQNDRFIFFKPAPGGPFGSINVPVTPYRSIATDKGVFPRACLAFADTRLPADFSGQIRNIRFASFVIDQDTGGAIRAAGRCDVYLGVGPAAETLAGRTGAEGALYYLFVRPAEVATVGP
jgi:membrane-bound lytic murein transglycosylase A